MQKGFDFWRAAGVSVGASIVAGFVYWAITPFTDSFFSIFLIKEVVLSAAIAALFAWIYFKGHGITVSAYAGFLLWVVMNIVPFVYGMVMGPLPEGITFPFMDQFTTIFILDALAMLVGTAGMGWYLAKK